MRKLDITEYSRPRTIWDWFDDYRPILGFVLAIAAIVLVVLSWAIA